MTLIQKRFGIEPVTRFGATGQFDVIVNGKKIAERGGNWFTRQFGAGYPDLNGVLAEIETMRKSGTH